MKSTRFNLSFDVRQLMVVLYFFLSSGALVTRAGWCYHLFSRAEYEYLSEYAISHSIYISGDYPGNAALLLCRSVPCKSGSAACTIADSHPDAFSDLDCDGDGNSDSYTDGITHPFRYTRVTDSRAE